MRLSRFARFSLVAVALWSFGCPESPDAMVSIRSAVAAGLDASEGRLTLDQIHSFPADLGDTWAVAYDPAVPAGCEPGGLTNNTPGGIPDRPCYAYLLHRRKSTWELRSKGYPGELKVPDEAPQKLGDRKRLAFLAP